jgi:membrane protease YdiL (CAAX protease family)
VIAAFAIGAGILVQVATWRLIAVSRVAFWPATSITFVVLGVAAVLVRDPGSFDAPALALGVGSGIVLYVATRIALGVLVRAAPFAASMGEVYGRSGELSTALVWVLTLVVAVPGEELFWRGLVLPELQDATTVIVGGCLAWLGYVAVNAVSRNLAILAAAIVCGGCWTILGAVDDVAAPVASHLVWTSLMLAWPPTGDRAKVRT